MQKTTTAITLAMMLMVVMTTSSEIVAIAHADSVEVIDLPAKTWIFTQNCDAVPVLQESLGPYPIPNNEVVCFPRASIINIEENVELLRQVFPNDIFVFTYDLRDAWTARDFTLFLRTHDTQAPAGALGRAFVEEGYAVAASTGLVIQHEYLHVSTCSVAHDQFGQPDTSKKIQGEYAWCP